MSELTPCRALIVKDSDSHWKIILQESYRPGMWASLGRLYPRTRNLEESINLANKALIKWEKFAKYRISSGISVILNY